MRQRLTTFFGLILIGISIYGMFQIVETLRANNRLSTQNEQRLESIEDHLEERTRSRITFDEVQGFRDELARRNTLLNVPPIPPQAIEDVK